jgi:hypothetical protein
MGMVEQEEEEEEDDDDDVALTRLCCSERCVECECGGGERALEELYASTHTRTHAQAHTRTHAGARMGRGKKWKKNDSVFLRTFSSD